ncbi:MAG: NAD(P)H-binding protein [Planctomycetales bacterium]|nr:NAD(P)H-binding protein [Planctomycetales bacterium]
MSKPKILLQLDADAQPSVFDAVVAVDSGVDQLLRHGGVTTASIRDLVHGAMFTRGPDELHCTAVFIGGSNVAAAEQLLAKARKCFFGPMRVSVMLDASGANTTAAAAVVAAGRHIPLNNCRALVLAATGPVGQRAARLLAGQGAHVRVASRSLARAAEVCQAISASLPDAKLTPLAVADEDSLAAALEGVALVVAAGAAGAALLPASHRRSAASLQVAIDLNAVAPAGIEGVEAMDKAALKGGVVCYGAVGVGGTKMKIHKAAIQRLFQSNDQVLDADEIYAIAAQLESQR